MKILTSPRQIQHTTKPRKKPPADPTHDQTSEGKALTGDEDSHKPPADPTHDQTSEGEALTGDEDSHKPPADQTHDQTPEGEALTGDEDSHKPPADPAHDQLSEREVFTGDEDFYKLVADSARTSAAQKSASPGQPLPVPTRHKRFSTIQKVLVACITATTAMLLYALLKPLLAPVTSRSPTPADQVPASVQQTTSAKPPAEHSPQAVQQQVQKPEPPLPPAQPLSLKVAETFFQEKNYDKALVAYSQLRQRLPTSPEEELLRDFLQLKMALCLKKVANYNQANHLFKALLQSHSPIIRITANYHL
ncbi:MAG: hypothetical protein ACYSWR_06020, partial [Planctomycetota bacterium]